MDEYGLPADWDFMDHDARVRWHMQRVEKESQIFNSLEEDGVMTCFEVEEVRERLERVREEKRMVEAAIMLAESTMFQEAVGRLRQFVGNARAAIAERAKILNLQMRRVNFRSTQDEEVRLARLRVVVHQWLDEAEGVEGEIIELCDKFGVDFGPFMMVDEVRDQA